LSFIFIILLAKKRKEVKNMSLEKMQSNSQTRSCKRRADRRQASMTDYHSELRAWVQHALLEAERNQDSKKSERFLSLLKEL
jgi:predicted RNA-binding protein with RPS1 domain